jgi:hypothetical protein
LSCIEAVEIHSGGVDAMFTMTASAMCSGTLMSEDVVSTQTCLAVGISHSSAICKQVVLEDIDAFGRSKVQNKVGELQKKQDSVYMTRGELTRSTK